MSRIQLSRVGRRVRRVKTALHRRVEASTGHKRGEGTMELLILMLIVAECTAEYQW